jgi:Fe-S-cluster containining protein
MTDPCRPCGACCAAMRVQFSTSELRDGGVPRDHVVDVLPKGHVAMRGTLGAEPRCEALDGAIGQHTGCRIYARRPGPCRAFLPSTAAEPNPLCDASRARHGLPPLVG